MDFADRPYRERLNALVQASCRRCGLRERLTDALLTRDAGDPRAAGNQARGISVQGRTAGLKKPAASDAVGVQGTLFAEK